MASGEKQGDRDAMDRVTERIIKQGEVSPERAREIARQSMIRTDREQREQGKR